MQRIVRLFVLLVAFSAPGAEARESARWRAGDDPRWAAVDWDDADWTPGNTVPARDGIFWIRYRVDLSRERQIAFLPSTATRYHALLAAAEINCVFLAAPWSYELYWDGERVGRSGVVGRTREEEGVGPLDNYFPLSPAQTRPGEHVVAMRMSSFHYNFPATELRPGFIAANLNLLIANETRRVVMPLISLGGAVLIAIISLLLYLLAERWRPLLLCGVASLVLALFYLLIAWRWLSNDPYDWFFPRLVAVTGAMTIVAWLFPWMMLEQFSVPGRRWWLIALAPALALAWQASEFYEFKTLALCYTMLGASLLIVGWAAWKRRPGAWAVFAALLLGILIVRADRREFLHASFFATFGVLVLVVFGTLGAQVRAHRRQAQAARVTAARLEIELLKKNIQPHFLLNTLATIIEVIEQEPKSAVALIEDMATEFRILARVSGEKLISLGQELELCRAHLRVMSRRKGARCALTVRGVDEDALVPPALLHTLIENGLTHLLPRDGRQDFELVAEARGEITRYTLIARGERQGDETAPRREGTGSRYLQARLEESFAGRWSIDAAPCAEGWRTVIEIGHAVGSGRGAVAARWGAEAAARPELRARAT